jgi:hypothetical protein
MTELLDSIHAAVTADATPEARAAGIAACRTILSALEATLGAPLASAPPVNASQIAASSAHFAASRPSSSSTSRSKSYAQRYQRVRRRHPSSR